MNIQKLDDYHAKSYAEALLKHLEAAKELDINLSQQSTYSELMSDLAIKIDAALSESCYQSEHNVVEITKETFSYVLDALKQAKEACSGTEAGHWIASRYEKAIRRAKEEKPSLLEGIIF